MNIVKGVVQSVSPIGGDVYDLVSSCGMQSVVPRGCLQLHDACVVFSAGEPRRVTECIQGMHASWHQQTARVVTRFPSEPSRGRIRPRTIGGIVSNAVIQPDIVCRKVCVSREHEFAVKAAVRALSVWWKRTQCSATQTCLSCQWQARLEQRAIGTPIPQPAPSAPPMECVVCHKHVETAFPVSDDHGMCWQCFQHPNMFPIRRVTQMRWWCLPRMPFQPLWWKWTRGVCASMPNAVWTRPSYPLVERRGQPNEDGTICFQCGDNATFRVLYDEWTVHVCPICMRSDVGDWVYKLIHGSVPAVVMIGPHAVQWYHCSAEVPKVYHSHRPMLTVRPYPRIAVQHVDEPVPTPSPAPELAPPFKPLPLLLHQLGRMFLWTKTSQREGWFCRLSKTEYLQAFTTCQMLDLMSELCSHPVFTLVVNVSDMQFWHVAYQGTVTSQEPTCVYTAYVMIGRLDQPGQMIQLSPMCQMRRKTVMLAPPITPAKLVDHLNGKHWVQYVGLLDGHPNYVMVGYWPFPWDTFDDGVTLQDVSVEGISRTSERWPEFAGYLQHRGALTIVETSMFADMQTRVVRFRFNDQPMIKSFQIWYGPRNKLPSTPTALLW